MSSTNPITATASPGRGTNIALWVIQVLLALAFAMAGTMKLVGPEMAVKQFELLGLGQWFRYLTGLLEIIAAVLLVLPAWSGFGALLLVPIMIGAAAAHVAVFKDNPAAPLVILGLAAIVAWFRLKVYPINARNSG
ncbi:DoxX family protein [Isosphaeraceae bacterium EP7]